MRRSFVRLGTILLAVATGAALAATAGFFDESTSRDSEAVAGAAAVRQFYAAVDDVLRTGDGTLLAGALAPDFVDHGAAPGLPGTADGLVRELAALRATFPHLQLVPEAVTAEGDRVAVRVEVAGENAASFLGLSLGSTVAPWGELDLFRVAAGKIVERWGTPAPAVLEPLGTAPLGPSPPAPQVVGLARLTFRPGAVYLDLADSVRLLYLESGTLAVTIANADTGTPTVGAGDDGARPSQLAAPTALSLSAGLTYTFRNEGAEPAVAIVAAVCDPQAPGRTAPGTGISMTAIWLSCDPDAQGQPASGAGADAGDAGSTQLPGGVVLQPM
ncbi:MAG TPA: ester cyclase, partial [Thermomicrobiales bacterium]